MKKLLWLTCASYLLGTFGASNTFAADEDFFGISEDTDEFGISAPLNTTAKSSANVDNNAVLSSFLRSKIPASAARNIEKAEKIFCYNVAYANPNEDSYLIDDMAVTGSCGELSDTGRQLFQETLWNNTSAFSNNLDNCNIAPKIVLRYVYGPDHTDVLLSYPCPAVIFFHGRDIVTINAAPAQQILEQITTAYANLSEKYLSPALMKQMVGNGQVTTQDQKEMVRRMNTTETARKKWSAAPQEPSVPQNTENKLPEAKPAAKGWNKLK